LSFTILFPVSLHFIMSKRYFESAKIAKFIFLLKKLQKRILFVILTAHFADKSCVFIRGLFFRQLTLQITTFSAVIPLIITENCRRTV
ncbi:MAG: hypothetical protein ACRCSA_13140, partial [Morganella morganii]